MMAGPGKNWKLVEADKGNIDKGKIIADAFCDLVSEEDLASNK